MKWATTKIILESLVKLFKSGYGIVAITSVFQTEEMGSIPIIRWSGPNAVYRSPQSGLSLRAHKGPTVA